MLELKNVKKLYSSEEKREIIGLDDVSLSFLPTGLVFVLGPSGSGKTTLLNLLGGIDNNTSGELYYNGINFSDLSMEEYRKNIVGFIFQEYNLLYRLNVEENISLITSSVQKFDNKKLVNDILIKVGLENYNQRRIQELSGGQKQRVAIGRALAKNCKILLCDEPTGNLDYGTSSEIFSLLQKISKEKLVIVVSHNYEMARKYGDRIISLRDGRVFSDEIINETNQTITEAKEQNYISCSSLIKYSITNLFNHKFKTIVSTMLLTLSLLSFSLMVIFLTYNSEYVNASSSKNDALEYIVQNGGSSNQPNALYYGKKIENIDSIISNEIRSDGYNIQSSTFYVISNDNKNILDNYSFYFRDELIDGYCYITDYYLKFVLEADNHYKIENYNDFDDLKNTKVYFDDVEQYCIAGIIKTDYNIFYDERGNEKKNTNTYADYGDYSAEFNKKSKYEYNVIFGNKYTLDHISIGVKNLNYTNPNYNISIHQGDYIGKISDLSIQLITKESNVEFYLNDGYFGSLSMNDFYTKEISLSEKEILISPYLYDYIFGTKTDWNELYINYRNALNANSPISGLLPHLGTKVSFFIENENKKISVNDVVVVGVSSEYYSTEKLNYTIFGNENLDGLSNSSLSNVVVSIINWKMVFNKLSTLQALREKNIVLSGAKYNVAYSLEYPFEMMSYFFIGLGLVLGLITCFSMINLVIHRINDNKKEIGVLFALGFTKNEVKIMYLVPIVIIVFIALCGAVFLDLVICVALNMIISRIGVGYLSLLSLNWQSLLSLSSSAFFVVLISFIPLRLYLNKKPIEIIR